MQSGDPVFFRNSSLKAISVKEFRVCTEQLFQFSTHWPLDQPYVNNNIFVEKLTLNYGKKYVDMNP